MSKKNGKKEAPATSAEAVVREQAPQVQELTTEQEIQGLRLSHQFFSQWPNVPGFAAKDWGDALNNLALVANSLISKAGLLKPPAKEEAPSANGAEPAAPQQ